MLERRPDRASPGARARQPGDRQRRRVGRHSSASSHEAAPGLFILWNRDIISYVMTKRSSDSASGTRAEGTPVRILDAAMALFAERGYRDTTVGDIEKAAGLAPRSGALYQHFSGKEQVLRACVERHVDDLDRMQDAMEMLPLGDLRAELLLIGRWNLADLSRRQPLYRFLWKEGDRFPDLRERVREAVVEKPLRRVAGWIRQRAADSGVTAVDCEALTLVIVQSLAAYRWLETVYESEPLGVGEQRFLNAWVGVCLAAIEGAGIDGDATTAST